MRVASGYALPCHRLRRRKASRFTCVPVCVLRLRAGAAAYVLFFCVAVPDDGSPLLTLAWSRLRFAAPRAGSAPVPE
ncbi:hypothetical protein K378_00003 [Streptomyces sp. Amel2xB2]|nr:hypothetical protein K378_00003 [Streptomyces sp. Amel2xB2]